MREKLPENFLRFKKAHPAIYEAFEELGRRLHEGRRLTCRAARHHDDRVAACARRDELGGGPPRRREDEPAVQAEPPRTVFMSLSSSRRSRGSRKRLRTCSRAA